MLRRSQATSLTGPRPAEREDCDGSPGLSRHVATCCVHPHDAAGEAGSHVGVDKQEVDSKGEARVVAVIVET